MQKKSISQPDLQHKVSCWLVKKDIHSIDNDETEVLVNSIAVSYTHLERKSLEGRIELLEDLEKRLHKSLVQICLLYTSRCV